MARFSNGWVKIHRKALLGDIGASYIRSGLFGTLIAIANLKESTVVWNGKPRKIQRGEMVTSLKELAELGDVDEKTVNRHLNYLVLRETIILEKSRTGTFIKFLNFEQYQSKDAEGSAQGPFGVDDNMEDEVRSSGIHIEEYNNKRTKEVKNLSDPFFQKRFNNKELPDLALLWNHYCGSLTKVVMTTKAWNRRCDELEAQYDGPELVQAITCIAGNSFLSGQNKSKWKATFSWFIKDDNIAKALNGDYDNQQSVDAMMAELSQMIEEGA